MIFSKVILISLWEAELGVFIGIFNKAELRVYCTFTAITVLKTQFYI